MPDLRMNRLADTPLSVLDLAPIREGGTPAEAFRNALDLARHAERWGYRRFWVAEHHNMPGIASAATAVVIGHIAGGTSRSASAPGGIMLPNHAPLVIAEQFGTLESLYPGRIDLGLGRAPGGDQRTARALRRKLGSSGDTFPAGPAGAAVVLPPRGPRARPCGRSPARGWTCRSGCSGRATSAPGSPPSSACPSPSPRTSRPTTCSRPSSSTARTSSPPRRSPGPMSWSASTSSRPTPTRRRGACSPRLQQAFLNLVRGHPGPLPPPVESMEGRWSPAERAHVERMTPRLRRRLARDGRARGPGGLDRRDGRRRADAHRRRSSTTRRGCARSRSPRTSTTRRHSRDC